MITSRWQKQNSALFPLAWALGAIFVLIPVWPILVFNLDGLMGVIVSIVSLAVGFVLIAALLKWNAKSLVRVLKVDYRQLENDIRKTLKNNHLAFTRTINDEESSVVYTFKGRDNLSMTVEKYHLFNLGTDDSASVTLTAAKITLEQISSETQLTADRIVKLIDGMLTAQTA